MEEKSISVLHTYPKGATGSYLTKNGVKKNQTIKPLDCRAIGPGSNIKFGYNVRKYLEEAS